MKKQNDDLGAMLYFTK